jgi:hypothetical protein
MEMAYLTHTRVLFDYFFREQLAAMAAGNAFDGWAGELHDALGSGVLEAEPTAALAELNQEEFFAYVGPVLGTLAAEQETVAAMAAVQADGIPLYPWTPAMAPELVGMEFAAMLGITLGHCQLLVPGPSGLVPQEDPSFAEVLPTVLNYLVDWTKSRGVKPDPDNYNHLTPLGL